MRVIAATAAEQQDDQDDDQDGAHFLGLSSLERESRGPGGPALMCSPALIS